MRRKYKSILLAWFFTLLAGILAGCSEGTAVQTPSGPPRSTQTADHPRLAPVTTTSSPAPEASYTPLETPTTPSITAPYHLIDPSDFSLNFELNTPIPSGRYIFAVEDFSGYETEIQSI